MLHLAGGLCAVSIGVSACCLRSRVAMGVFETILQLLMVFGFDFHLKLRHSACWWRWWYFRRPWPLFFFVHEVCVRVKNTLKKWPVFFRVPTLLGQGFSPYQHTGTRNAHKLFQSHRNKLKLRSKYWKGMKKEAVLLFWPILYILVFYTPLTKKLRWETLLFTCALTKRCTNLNKWILLYFLFGEN